MEKLEGITLKQYMEIHEEKNLDEKTIKEILH